MLVFMCKNILMNQHNNQSTIFLNPKIRYYIIIWLNISVFLFFPSSKNSNYTSKELPTNNNYWNTTFHIISYHIIQRNIYSSGLRKTTKTTIIYPKRKNTIQSSNIFVFGIRIIISLYLIHTALFWINSSLVSS